jgi:hypothetical protein
MLYAILMASRKLRHYFQAHQVIVVTLYPLGHILRNREGTGRMVKWAIELAEFGLQFYPGMRSRVKPSLTLSLNGPRSPTSSDRKKPRT